MNTEKEKKKPTKTKTTHAHQQNWHYEVFRSRKDTVGVRILRPHQPHSTGGLWAAQAPQDSRIPSCGRGVGLCWVSSKRSEFLHLVAQSLGSDESFQSYQTKDFTTTLVAQVGEPG